MIDPDTRIRQLEERLEKLEKFIGQHVGNQPGAATANNPHPNLDTGGEFEEVTVEGSINIGVDAVVDGQVSADIVSCNTLTVVTTLTLLGDMTADGIILNDLEINGAFNHDGTTFGAMGATPVVRPSLSGSRSSQTSLVVTTICDALEALGLATDLTTV